MRDSFEDVSELREAPLDMSADSFVHATRIKRNDRKTCMVFQLNKEIAERKFIGLEKSAAYRTQVSEILNIKLEFGLCDAYGGLCRQNHQARLTIIIPTPKLCLNESRNATNRALPDVY